MKRKILMGISLLLVMGLAIAALAYNSSNHSHQKAMASCCSKDGSCPMKDKNAGADTSNEQAASCCDKPDCPCRGGADSCPMKKQTGTTSQPTGVEMNSVTVAISDENCCQKGADCCKNGGDCCKKHKKS